MKSDHFTIQRFEVIDHRSSEGKGRVFVAMSDAPMGIHLEVSVQDNEATLKVFLRDEPVEREEGRKRAPRTPNISRPSKGLIRTRSQSPNPITGTWTKRADRSGKFMDVKAEAKPFKGVRREKKKA